MIFFFLRYDIFKNHKFFSTKLSYEKLQKNHISIYIYIYIYIYKIKLWLKIKFLYKNRLLKKLKESFFLKFKKYKKNINQIYYQYHTTKNYLDFKNISKYINILNNFF